MRRLAPATLVPRPPRKRFSQFQFCDLAVEHADVARILESAEVQPQCSRATGWVSAAFLAAVRQALLVLLAKWMSLDAAEAAQALDFGHQSAEESGVDDDDDERTIAAGLGLVCWRRLTCVLESKC